MTPKQHLQTLANFLATVPSEKFDLLNWRSATPSALSLSDQSLTDPSCRPTGCAVGTRPAYPAFQAEGLSFRPEINTGL